ncbi:polyprenyl synthetase family protein [Leptobacterium sp. I13]|uniref:polyprenyl synthetase family protein n=1 Tax=Leptobacterium meishanense TaxID=3128904 RepID=UPI0030EB5D31
MLSIQEYRKAFLGYLAEKVNVKEPHNLYAPVEYMMQLGGKRIRPILTLMTAAIFDSNYKKALDAALAIEMFHNFSLVHDDIMDDAPIRRGKLTVHKKWDISTAVLSGDAMLIMAYNFLEGYDEKTFKKLLVLFNKTAMQVCEGQQYDIDFETREDVTLPEYMKMVEYKTAVLIGAAMKMGAIVAQSSMEDAQAISNFGVNLGIAFQLQDDYLDVFGDPKTFGKQTGGDIIENKKTFLYLKALEKAPRQTAQMLRYLFSIQPPDATEKIKTVKNIYKETEAVKMLQKAITNYTEKAFKELDRISINEGKKAILKQFGEDLMSRTI